NFSDLYQYVYDMAMTELSHFNFAAVFAFIGAMFYVVTYYMKTMVPLRIVGIIANLFFIAYGYFYPQYLTLLLYLGILPINVYRLIEMRRLIEQVKRSADTDQSMDWLKPFMTKRTYKKVQELYFQNPTFGFYFLRLTTERLLQNVARLEAALARREFAASASPAQERKPVKTAEA